jgi:TP901 family phage tail tape measure protein
MAAVDIVIKARDEAARVLKGINQSVKDFGKSIEKSSRELRNLGTQITGVGVALLGVSAIPVKFAADFEQALSQIKAQFANLTGKEFKALEDTARQLGETTKFTAVEAANGLVILGRSGLSAKEAIAGVPAVLQTASAATIEFTEAARLLVDVSKQFRDQNISLQRAGDILVKTAQVSNQNILELSEAFNKTGPLAAALGVPIETVSTLLAIFAQRGVRASIAGTGLRTVLLGLIKQSGAGFEVLENLNISLEDGAGNLRPLEDILADLGKALEGLPKAARGAELEKIFGRRGIVAAFAALQSLKAVETQAEKTGEGVDGLRQTIDNLAGSETEFQKLNREITQSEGTIRKVADIQLDNLIGDFTKLRSSLESLLIQAGKPFLGFVRNLINIVSEYVKTAREWIKNNQETAKVIGFTVIAVGGFLAALGSLLVVLGSLGLAIAAATKAFGAFAVVGKGLAVVFTALGAKIAIIVGLIVLAATEFKTGFIRNFEIFGVRIGEIVQLLIVSFNTLITKAQILFNKITDTVKGAASLAKSFGSQISGGQFITGEDETNKKNVEFLEKQLQAQEKIRQSILNQIEARNKVKGAREAGNEADLKAATDLKDKFIKEIKEIEAEFKNLSTNTQLKIKTEIDPLKIQQATESFRQQSSAADLEIAKLQGKIERLQFLAQRGDSNFVELFAARRELIVKEFDKEIADLEKQLQRNPTLDNKIRSQIEVVEQRRRNSLQKLEQEEIQAQENIKQKRIEIDEFLKRRKLDTQQELSKNELDQLDFRQRRELANLEEKHRQELANLEDLVRAANATSEDLEKLRDIQKQERENVLASQNQERSDLVQRNALELDSLLANAASRGTDDLEIQHEAELAQIRLRHQAELEDLERLTKDKVALRQLEAFQTMELAKADADFRQRLLLKSFEQAKILTGGTADLFSQLYELSGKKAKEFFFASKAIALAQAAINTAEGVTKALAQGGIFGIANAGIIAATGAVQIAAIAKESIGFNKGGLVVGGSGLRDDVPAKLTGGEYVINKPTVAKYGVRFFEGLQAGMLPSKVASVFSSGSFSAKSPRIGYQTGGVVSLPTTEDFQNQPQQAVTVVNANRPELLQRYLQETAGERVLFNVLESNREELQRIVLSDI